MNRPKDVRGWLMCAVLPLTACGGGTGQEITSTKPYADLIGARYSVVADTLSAYGVYQSSGDKEIGYITLVPMGISGSEFAFRRTVPRGQTIRIQSAWRLFPLMERSVYYLVAVENSDLPEGVPVRLQLDRGNEGVDADLNPAVYKKLPKDN